MTETATTESGELIEDFWEALDKSPYLMIGLPAQAAHSEPMNVVFDKDYPNALFIYTSTDNRLVEGMRADPKAVAQFASKGHDFWACLDGRLSRVTDDIIIDRFWSNSVEAWYDQGRQDPRLVMLRFDIADAEMWESDISAGGLFKLLTGTKIEPSEAAKHAEVTL